MAKKNESKSSVAGRGKDEAKVGPGRRVSYQTTKFGRDGASYTSYFASIPIDELYGCCAVLTRTGDPVEGYQRDADERRAQQIADYLDEGGIILGNIILAAQPASELAYNRSNKTLAFTRAHGAFAVIDGQHRLWGYEKAKTRLRVPCSIVEGLSRAEEAQLFTDTNGKQKGVAASLLLDIKALAARENERESVMRELYDGLANDPESPLHGRVSPTGAESGKLSRVSFNRAFAPLFASSDFFAMKPGVRLSSVHNYLAAFAAVVGPDLLIKSGPFAAAVDVMLDVLQDAVEKHGDILVPSIKDVLAPVGKIWSDPSSVRGSKTSLVAGIKDAIARSKGFKITESMVAATPTMIAV